MVRLLNCPVSVPPVPVASRQPMEVTPQLENASTTASYPPDPTTWIRGLAVVATKEYQTSSSAFPTQPVKVCVAFREVPEVGIQLAFWEMEKPGQLLLEGAGA